MRFQLGGRPGLIIFARVAMKTVKEIPSRSAEFLGWMVEACMTSWKESSAINWSKRRFVFCQRLHFHPVFQLGRFLPFFGTVGWGIRLRMDSTFREPLLRGCQCGLEHDLAMAFGLFGCWTVWPCRPWPDGILLHLFAPKGDTTAR